MGKYKEVMIKDLALEIEAENVAREVPMLTLECEHMLQLIRECHDLLACIEGLKVYFSQHGKDVTHMIDKIEKLEKRIEQK